MISALKGVLFTVLFLTYPYLIYRSMESGMVWLAPAFFSVIFLLQAIKAPTLTMKLYKSMVSIGLLLGCYYIQTITAKVLPVLIQLMLMYFFGRTLFKGKGPSFIESFVLLEFPQSPPSMTVYFRQLTILWTGFFAFNVLMCIVLAIWSNDKWWALYNGVFIYLMIGILVMGEYIYRHFRFPDLSMGIPSVQSTIKTMIVNGRKIWMDVQAR